MRLLALSLVPIAALTAAGCGGGGGSPPLQPQYQPQITNATNSFSFQLTGVVNGDGSLGYFWQNTGTAATVDRSSAISAGVVALTIRDAAGVAVYQGPLNGVTGSVATATGVAGTWTITVDFAGATGTINFRVQMK